MLNETWSGLGRNARVGLVAGVLAIAALFAASAWWLLRTDYEVLFADLKQQDAAAIVAELDKMKVPYRLADNGSTVLVDGTTVHSTRLKLMGKEMPLHGAVGFELFNNADFGMTEFAQKINYQRALQGEITRTILSLAEVRDVRVHLALPEEGLFKKSTAKAKAAITLSLKPGQSLRAEQVSGIQRLVSAAVPGIAAQDVTLVDQQGIALTRSAAPEGESEPASGRLDLKKETEQLLARKATEVLDRSFGPGQAIASVDVVLNLDQVRTTTEDVLGAPGKAGQGSAGVMVREREVLRETAAPLDVRRDAAARTGGSQREIEYQVGRRIEQVVSLPGAIRRLQLVAVVRRPVDAVQLEQLRALLGAAVGAVPDRGDVIVVQSLVAFESLGNTAPAAVAAGKQGSDEVLGTSTSLPPVAAAAIPGWKVSGILAALALLVAGVGVVVLMRARSAGRAQALTADQRERLVRQVRAWLAEEPGGLAPQPQPAVAGAEGRTSA